MKTVEPWKAIAFVILLFAVAGGINSLLGISQHRPAEFVPPIQASAPPVQADANLQVQRQQAEAQASAQAHANLLERYINSGFSRKPGLQTYALIVASDSGGIDHALNGVLNRHFKDPSNEILPSLFKPAFISDGLFNSVFSGS